MSKKLTLDAGGTTATVEDAKLSDVVTTLIDTDAALTGMLGLTQHAGLFVAGMAFQSYRKSGTINPFA